MNYKVLKEHDTHFDVHDGKSQFRVAKNGLSKSLIGKIRGYDSGGPVSKAGGSDYISNALDTLIPPGSQSQTPDPAPVDDSGAAAPAVDQSAEAQNLLNNMRGASSTLAGGPTAWGKALGFSPSIQGPTPFSSDVDGAPPVAPQAAAASMQADPNAGPSPASVPQSGAPQQQAGQLPSQAGGLPADLMNAQNAMIAGTKGMANAKSAEGQQVSQAWAGYQQQIAAQQQMTEKALADNEAQGQALQQGIMTGKVDPHRLWNDSSTGNKILASIGLALGGIGAGLTHGPNQALEVMQNAINRDVEAQKFNLNKQETLYGYNLKKYGDIRSADAATKVQLGTVLQAQIAQAAAQSGSAQAQANAQYMTGQIQQQMIPYKMQIAQMQGQAMTHQVGGIPEHSPLDQQQMVMNPKYAETRVPINGKVFQANSKEDAEKLRSVETLAGPVVAGINTLSQLGPAAAIPGTKENQIAEGIRGDLAVKLPLMSGAEIGAKRINGEEIKHQLERIKDPTSFTQMVNGGVKNDEFFKSLSNEMESMRENSLLNYKGMGSIPNRNPGFK